MLSKKIPGDFQNVRKFDRPKLMILNVYQGSATATSGNNMLPLVADAKKDTTTTNNK